MKAAEVRELSVKDLQERIETEKVNYVRMRLNHAVSPIEDMSKIGKARRNIARMLTVLSQKEKNENNK
ncbi:MAG: 50S ribosomal protein L29 [Prevotellaceae bacterium]|jgi:large subunit ribosomal protein L29|nr:50S ribosomal protein L29 [Prevotellaceae bacterium]